MSKPKITIKKDKEGNIISVDILNDATVERVRGKDGLDGINGQDGEQGSQGETGAVGKVGPQGKDADPSKMIEMSNKLTGALSSAEKNTNSINSAKQTIQEDIMQLDANLLVHENNEDLHFVEDEKEEWLKKIEEEVTQIVQTSNSPPLNYSPITGDIDLKTYGLDNVGHIQFDLEHDVTDIEEGHLHWNTEYGTLEAGLAGGNVNLQMGQELLLPRRVKNTSGSDMEKGSLVYISGGDGVNAYVSLAKADTEETSANTIAMLTEDINNGKFGYATTAGLVRGRILQPLDTFSYAEGDTLYLSEITAGAFTDVKPESPNHLVAIGQVFRSHATEGMIIVRIINGFELEELHNVHTSSTANGDIIQWNADNLRWENSDIFNKMEHPTGFPNRTDSTISFTEGTRTFSIQPTVTDFDFYSCGVKLTSTGDTVTITDTEGLWFIYYTSTGVLTASLTPWAFDCGHVYVSILYWDATNKTNLGLGEERHGTVMDSATHEYLHEHFGAVWESGFTPSIIADGNGSLDSHCEIQSVSAGVFDDEDIEHNSIEQTADFIMLYKESSGAYFRKAVQGNSLVNITGTRPNYNEFLGGSWTRTEVANTKFTLTHLFATNSILPQKNILVMGENQYNSKADAQDGAHIELTALVTGALPTPEFVAIATFIIECKDAYTNTYNARVVSTSDGGDFVDFRVSEKTGVGAVATDHGNLAGLTEDDHIQYWGDATTASRTANYATTGTVTAKKVLLPTLSAIIAEGTVSSNYLIWNGTSDLLTLRNSSLMFSDPSDQCSITYDGSANSLSFGDTNLATTGDITANKLLSVKLGSLTSNGFVKTSGSDGTLSIDTNTYLTTASASAAYVPYNGASTSVDLGSNNLTVGGTVKTDTTDSVGGLGIAFNDDICIASGNKLFTDTIAGTISTDVRFVGDVDIDADLNVDGDALIDGNVDIGLDATGKYLTGTTEEDITFDYLNIASKTTQSALLIQGIRSRFYMIDTVGTTDSRTALWINNNARLELQTLSDIQAAKAIPISISLSTGDITYSGNSTIASGKVFSVGTASGTSGTFTSADGKTVTVTGGLVTNIS